MNSKLITILTIALSLTIVGGKAYANQTDQNVKTAEVDSTLIKPYIAKIEVYKDLLKEAEKDANKQAEESKSKIEDLESKIKRLEKQKKTLNDSIKKLNEEINSVKSVSNRKLISMASNFIYIPYEDYSINKIAIPAFESAMGSKEYDEYKGRLPLLEKYKEDIDSIRIFLGGLKETFFTKSFSRNTECSNTLKKLKDSEVYKRYQTYPDWKATYLGGKIVKIEAILNRPSAQTYSELMKVKKELEDLK